MTEMLPPLKFAQTPTPALAGGTACPGEPVAIGWGLILGCVQRLFNPGVNAATVRVLRAVGL
jgi:hypothetical protein